MYELYIYFQLGRRDDVQLVLAGEAIVYNLYLLKNIVITVEVGEVAAQIITQIISSSPPFFPFIFMW